MPDKLDCIVTLTKRNWSASVSCPWLPQAHSLQGGSIVYTPLLRTIIPGLWVFKHSLPQLTASNQHDCMVQCFKLFKRISQWRGRCCMCPLNIRCHSSTFRYKYHLVMIHRWLICDGGMEWSLDKDAQIRNVLYHMSWKEEPKWSLAELKA